MVNTKILKKKLRAFFISKYFFSFLLISIVLSIFYVGYIYIKDIQNNKAFSSLYGLLERYESLINSHSLVPIEELIEDINKEEKNLGFFCSIKKQFVFLKIGLLLQSKKIDDALLLLKKNITNDNNSEIDYLYNLVLAIVYAANSDINKKQEGIKLLKNYTANKKFQDIAIFYYGYFLLKNNSLKQADEVWAALFNDPQFNHSPYKLLVEEARNCDY